jgi:uncharacterized protein with GYD domain
MARHLFIAKYTSEGVRGVVANGGSARRASIEAMGESAGGWMETFDFAFGSDDVYTVIDLPDNTAAAAAALAVNAIGQASVRTVALLTPEEVDQAASRSVDYPPPVH